MGTIVHSLLKRLQTETPEASTGCEEKDQYRNLSFSLFYKEVLYLYMPSYIISMLTSKAVVE